MLLLGTAMAVSAPRAGAQTNSTTVSPEAMQAAQELVSVLSGSVLTNITARTVTEGWPQVEAALRHDYPNIDAATLAELRSEFERQQISSAFQAMNSAPAVYARHFTVPEMREITAFYRTPTGAKTLRVLPETMTELITMAAPQLQKDSSQLKQTFAAILQRHGYRN